MRRASLSSRNLFRLLKPKKQQNSYAAASRHLCSESEPNAPPVSQDTSTSSIVVVPSLQTAKPDEPPSIVDITSRQIVSLLQTTNAEEWTCNSDLKQLLFGSPALSPSVLLNTTRQLCSYETSFQFFNYFKDNRVHEASATSMPTDPNALSFVFQAVLEHASREEGSKAPAKLQELFTFAREQNVPLSVKSASLLMKCFGRAKMFEQTVAVFNALDPSLRNTSVVNMMLGTMLKENRVDDALKLLDEMLRSKLDFFPNWHTMNVLLSAILTRNWGGRNLSEEEIFQIVLTFGKGGIFPSSFWLSQIITKFCRRGKCDKAWDVLHEVMRLGGEVDTVPCNSLLTGLGKEHDFQRMNLLMREMKEKNIQPNVVTFGILINHLCKVRKVDHALEVFERMRQDTETGGFSVKPDVVLYNTLIDGLCKVGRQEEALVFMERMRSEGGFAPNAITYNSLMDGLCKAGEIDRSLELFNQMKSEGVEPNVITLNTLLDGMTKCGRVSSAMQLFNEMLGNGLQGDATTYTVLITAFCNVNNIDRAMKLFNQMSESGISPDATAYRSLISGLSQAGRTDDASFVVSKMRAAGFCLDVIDYNVLICGFCRKNKIDKAFELFELMDESGVRPDRITYNTLISYSSEKGDFETAHGMWKKMLKDGISPSVVTYGAIIHAYCKAGKLDEAMKIYKEMSSASKSSTKRPNTVIYNTLINAFCKCDKVEVGLALLADMKDNGVRPNTSTFNSLLKGLQERHWLEKAFELMDQMNKLACSPDYITMEILSEWLSAIGQTEKLQAFVQGYEVSASTT